MGNTEFAQLIDRYLKGELSAEEKLKLENWLDNLSENTEADFSETELAAAGKRIYNRATDKIELAENPAKPALIVRLKPLLKIASCFFIAGLFLYIFHVRLKEIFNIQQVASISNTKGHITKTILSDGTIIWLKGNSRLDFPIKFKAGLRVVRLNGEALFEVAKDKAHPFIIHSGALTTRVLGTSFNIKQNHDQTEVAVLTGHVFLSSKNLAPVVLQPYQKGVFSQHKKTLIKEAQPELQVADLTDGTEYNMLFNDAQLAEVLRHVEKKFEVNVKLGDQGSGKSLITADLTDQSLTNTLNMISSALNLNYIIDGQSVVLKKPDK